MNNHDSPRLLTVEQAADLLSLGRTTTYELIRSGQLWAIHVGRATRISRDELERFIRTLDRPQATKADRNERRRTRPVAPIPSEPTLFDEMPLGEHQGSPAESCSHRGKTTPSREEESSTENEGMRQ